MKAIIRLLASVLVLSGCTRSGPPGVPTPPVPPVSFSGVWAGDAGPNLAALKFGAKIEIQEDGGSISGEFFNEDPERPGVYLPTGSIQGTRDGGTLFLTTGAAVDMGDAGHTWAAVPHPQLRRAEAGGPTPTAAPRPAGGERVPRPSALTEAPLSRPLPGCAGVRRAVEEAHLPRLELILSADYRHPAGDDVLLEEPAPVAEMVRRGPHVGPHRRPQHGVPVAPAAPETQCAARCGR